MTRDVTTGTGFALVALILIALGFIAFKEFGAPPIAETRGTEAPVRASQPQEGRGAYDAPAEKKTSTGAAFASLPNAQRTNTLTALMNLPLASRRKRATIDLSRGVPFQTAGISRLSRLPDGTTPNPPQLTYANSVSADDKGNVFVADSGNNRILKLDSDGNIISAFGTGNGGPELSDPKGIAVAEFGNITLVAVADSGSDQVVLYNQNGDFLGILGAAGDKLGALNDPEGVTINPEGRTILVADTMNHRVVEYSFDGTVKNVFGDADHLQFPKAVAVSENGSVYVSNFGKDSVAQFDGTGRYVTDFLGESNNPMIYPTGLDIDSQGQIWVSEMGSGRVRVLSPDGKTVSIIGGAGSAGVTFDHPKSISVQNGTMWVASPGRQWVQKIVFQK